MGKEIFSNALNCRYQDRLEHRQGEKLGCYKKALNYIKQIQLLKKRLNDVESSKQLREREAHKRRRRNVFNKQFNFHQMCCLPLQVSLQTNI